MAQRLIGRVPAAALTAVAAAALLGAGCVGQNALGLVHQACGHVQRSLQLLQASEASGLDPASVQQDRTAALVQLRDALPLAARAAGEDAEWQAFMTTLSESSRVPESDLVEALTQQCAGAGTAPQPGTGPPTTPSPASSTPVPTFPS